MRQLTLIMLALALGLAHAEEDSKPATPSPSPQTFTRAIEIVEFVSRLSTESQANLTSGPSTTADLVNTLSLVDLLWDVVAKALSVLLSGLMYAVSLVFDPATATTMASGPSYYTSTSPGSISYRDFDYRLLVDSLGRLPDQAFNVLDIKEQSCRKRAVCELSSHLTTYLPVLSDWVRLIALRLESPVHQYARDAARGMGWNDCHLVYQDQCPVSPFKKFYRLYNTLAKLY